MDRREAAQFLGVSLRTLDRLSAKHHLTKGRVQMRTRPAVVFVRAEIEALKAALDIGRRTTKAYGCTEVLLTGTVAFRLDNHYMARLSQAGSEHAMSPGEYARHLTIRALEDTSIDEFSLQVKRLRESLADTFYAFLTMKFGVSEDEANRFIEKTILRD